MMANRENKGASRRVEFRVVTNAEEKLYELIDALKKNQGQYAANKIEPNYNINSIALRR